MLPLTLGENINAAVACYAPLYRDGNRKRIVVFPRQRFMVYCALALLLLGSGLLLTTKAFATDVALP